MGKIKSNMKLMRSNIASIFVFEIVYKLASMAVLIPVIYWLFNTSVHYAGLDFVSERTMSTYFKSPSTYAFALLLLTVLALYFLINISAIIYAIDATHKNERTNAVFLLLKGVSNSFRTLRPRNIAMLGHVILILPFTFAVTVIGSLAGVKVPSFIVKYVMHHQVIVGLVLFVYILLCMLAVRTLFALNYYTLYHTDYRKAKKAGKIVANKHTVSLIVEVVLINIALLIVLLLLEGAFAAVAAGVLRKVFSIKKLNFVFSLVIQGIFTILYVLFSITATPIIYSVICGRFYSHEEETDSELHKEIRENYNKRKKILTPKQLKKRNVFTVIAVTVFAIALNGVYITLIIRNRININLFYPTRAEVIAHRGDSKHAPENTMAAFRLAVENQADMIELDVRQTRDGCYIIMHDESLKRTTGLDRKVGEVNYAYIQKLEAGSHFSEEYAGEPIPTLDEVLAFAVENDISLCIELKPSKLDHNYVQGILQLIYNYGAEDLCYIASMDYKVLQEVKRLDSNFTTVYIISVAMGDLGRIEDADIFSVKSTFISANMVKNVHKQGKEIYAWTVNDSRTIKNLLLMDIDSVITDNPYYAKDVIYNANDTLISDWFGRIIEDY